MKRFAVVTVIALVIATMRSGYSERGPGTVEELKKLAIICFVPSWLPEGFKLTRVHISYDEPGPDEENGRFPLYQIEYAGAQNATFSIDSAPEGIGDRNLMDAEDAEEATLHSALFGDVYVIYRPKGAPGLKKEVIANWVEDANLKREKKRDPKGHPNLGRYHGFSASGMTLADFTRIVESLHPQSSAATK